MLDAPPCEVGDVEQAVDAAQIDERAVIRDVLDHPLDDRAFVQLSRAASARSSPWLCFQHRAARHDDVVALAVELDDLELHVLVLVRGRVLDRPDVDERAGQEGADAVDHHGEPALDLAVDDALTTVAFLQRILERVPGRETLRLVTRQARFAVAVLERLRLRL